MILGYVSCRWQAITVLLVHIKHIASWTIGMIYGVNSALFRKFGSQMRLDRCRHNDYGNTSVTGGIHHKGPNNVSHWYFVVVNLNMLLNKQSSCSGFETSQRWITTVTMTVLMMVILMVLFMMMTTVATISVYMHAAKMTFMSEEICWSWYAVMRIHYDVIKWKHFPHCWPFVRGIHRPQVDSNNKGQWRGALMCSLICTWTNGWANNRDASDLRRHRTHYGVSNAISRTAVYIECDNAVFQVYGSHYLNFGPLLSPVGIRHLLD